MTPRAGRYGRLLYPRLRAHFQFQNELQLFPELDHHSKYSINLYGPPQEQPSLTIWPTCLPLSPWMPVMPTTALVQWVASKPKMANGTSLATVTASCV